MSSFYSEEELAEVGFASIGANSFISRKCSIYMAERIHIGSHVRIDDFCIISGEVRLGDYIHIGAGSFIFGGETGVIIDDFSSLSSRCVIYAESDDFFGDALGNPTVPNQFRKVSGARVVIGKYVSVGTGSTILPGATIEEGVSVGAMSLVNRSLKEWGLYAGIHPCKRILDLERTVVDKAGIVKAEHSQ